MSYLATFSFFIQLFDYLSKVMERQVDVFRFFQSLPIDPCLAGTLGSRQIHQMELGRSLHVFPHLLAFHLQNEDAVRSGRCVVLGCLTHYTVSISNEEKIECVFLILCSVDREVLKHELVICDLVHLNLWQIKETLSCMILIQQVIATVIVDLEVAHIKLVGVGVPLRELAEDVRDGPGDDSTIRISLSATCDGEGLS